MFLIAFVIDIGHIVLSTMACFLGFNLDMDLIDFAREHIFAAQVVLTLAQNGAHHSQGFCKCIKLVQILHAPDISLQFH